MYKDRKLQNTLIIIFVSFVILYLLMTLTLLSEFIIFYDYKAFLTGAHLLITDSSNLYDLQIQNEVQTQLVGRQVKFLPFRNPPFVALAYIPLLFFKFYDSYVIFIFITFLLLLILNVYLAKLEKIKNLPLIILFTFSFYPNISAILNGQPAILCYVIFVSIYLFYKKRNEFGVGLMSGLLLIKPQFILAVPILFLSQLNKKSFIRGFFVSFSIFLIASNLLSNDFLTSYMAILIRTENVQYGSNLFNMSSLAAFFVRFLSHQIAIFTSLFLYLVFIIIFIKINKALSSDALFLLSVQ